MTYLKFALPDAHRPMLLAVLALFALPVQSDQEQDVLATRGAGVLTQQQFDAHVDRIPQASRRPVLRDRAKLEDILDQLLISKQLAAAARAEGFEQSPLVRERMQLAAEEELARAWLVHVVSEQSTADYEAMAREYWQLNKSDYMTTPSIDVSHILIGTQDRSDEEALQLAEDLYGRLQQDPQLFEQLVAEFSDDPSASGNKGRFANVQRGQMVKPFEEAAFALEPGGLSGPVKTIYGYHLIRLNGMQPAKQRPFSEFRAEILAQVRAKHAQELQNAYLAPFYAETINISDGGLEAMVERQFGIEVDE